MLRHMGINPVANVMAVNTAVYVYQMTHPPASGYLPTPSGDDNPWPLLISIIIGVVIGVVLYKILP